jgi:hypothetical protein
MEIAGPEVPCAYQTASESRIRERIIYQIRRYEQESQIEKARGIRTRAGRRRGGRREEDMEKRKKKLTN